MADLEEKAFHRGATFACPTCALALTPGQATFDAYFDGVNEPCPNCKTPIVLWDVLLDRTENWFVFGDPLAFAGAHTVSVRETLRGGETKRIDLTSHGVPSDAEVLYLNLTSAGSALPMLVHGNEVPLGPIPPVFFLLGRAVPDQGDEGPLSVHAVWHRVEADDTTIRHLVDAAHQYQRQRFDALVVPANIAAEAALTPVIAKALRPFGGRDNVNAYLRDAATYSHQLNVLLGLVAHLLQTSAMPAHVRGLLNRLRNLRNQLAHTGAALNQSRRNAAEHLVAAIFAVRYATRLASLLEASEGAGSSATAI